MEYTALEVEGELPCGCSSIELGGAGHAPLRSTVRPIPRTNLHNCPYQLREQYVACETGTTGAVSRSQVRGSRNLEPRASNRAFLAFYAPRTMALADCFSILPEKPSVTS